MLDAFGSVAFDLVRPPLALFLSFVAALQWFGLPKKEVIQPHLPVRLPCYDFTPVTSPAFGVPFCSQFG